MSKSKKAPVYQYGIEITKPHSIEMYNHNDMVAEEMKRNIASVWADEMIKYNKTDEWAPHNNSTMNDIQKSICAVGFGEGFTIDEVHKDFMSNLSDMANWQLHEEYSYLSFKNGIVPRTRFMMVGFEWEKHDYSFCTEADLSPVLDMVGFEGTIEALNKI